MSPELWQYRCSSATVARPFHDLSLSYGVEGHEQQDTDVPVNAADFHLMAQGFHPGSEYLSLDSQQETQDFGSHPGMPSLLHSPMPGGPDHAFGLDHQQALSSHMPRSRQMSQVSSHLGSPYDSPQTLSYGSSAPPSRKRSRQEDFLDFPAFQQLQAHAVANGTGPLGVDMSGLGHAMQPAAMQYTYSSHQASPRSTHSRAHSLHSFPQQHHHHHHGLQHQPIPDGFSHLGFGDTSPSQAEEDPSHPSVVGQPGMPEPAPRPKGPKLKFTPEDDGLLVELKETKNLTWKQIADFFPGRTSGTLQVRYCTKLKAKTTKWTDELEQKLRSAVHEYHLERWRIVANKVGNGLSSAACREKAIELDITHELPLDADVVAAASSASGSASGEDDATFDLRSSSLSSTMTVITPPSSQHEA